MRQIFLFYAIVFSFSVAAQTISVNQRGSEFRLVSAEGKSLTNFIFTDAEVDTVENFAKVVHRGKMYVLNSEGKMIVPHSIDEEQLLANSVYADLKGPEATGNVYDLKGNILASHMKELSVKRVNDFGGKQKYPLYVGRSETDEKDYIYGPNLVKLYPNDAHIFYYHFVQEYLPNYNTRYCDLLGRPITPSNSNVCWYKKIIELSSKRTDKYRKLYSYDDFNKLGLFVCHDGSTINVYSTDGSLLHSERCKKNAYKKVDKVIYKVLDYFMINKGHDDVAAYNKMIQEVENTFGKGKKYSSPSNMLSINDYLLNHSIQYIFPILQKDDYDTDIATSKIGKKLKQNKYGKISECIRVVDNSGMIFFVTKYENRKKGILDKNGNVLIPPTNHEINFSNKTSVFYTFDLRENEPVFRQFYDWKGNLICDFEKKGYEKVQFHFDEDNLRFFKVMKNNKWGVVDYYGVLRVPIAYTDPQSIIYTDTKKIAYVEGDFGYETSFTIPDTSRPGGKPSIPVKLPTESQVQKELASKKTEFYASQRQNKYFECFRRFESLSSSYDKQKVMEECLNYCENDDQKRRVLNNIGVQYHSRGEYASALKYYRASADLGNTTAIDNIERVNKLIAQQQITQQQQIAQQQQAKQDNTATIMYGIADALNQLAQAFEPSQTNYQQGNNYQYNNSQYNNHHYSGNTRNHNSTANTTNQDGVNWRSDSRVYNDYDSKLAAMQTLSWPYQNGYNDSDRIKYQREMKRIRQKWQNKGYTITKSSREDWNGR